MTAVVDSSVLYALLDAEDGLHAECVAALAAEQETVIVPIPALSEVCMVIGSRLGSQNEAAFVRHLAESDWRVEPVTGGDLERIVPMMAEHEIGFTDAAIAAIAERMSAGRIYTLDRRGFERLRPKHVERFELLPAR